MEEKNLFLKPIIILLGTILIFLIGTNKLEMIANEKTYTKIKTEDKANRFFSKKNKKPEIIENEEPKSEIKNILISAIGDCTIGADEKLGYSSSFTQMVEKQKRDFSYFFSGVYDILSKDDLTIANLEGTFTNSTERVEKKFNFKGDLDYPEILKKGSVETVNLANNHVKDYGEAGYKDTKQALENYKIPYFGFNDYQIIEVKGIKIGLAGFVGWDETTAKNNTKKAINYFHKNNTDLIIINYHWGDERVYTPTPKQYNIGHYAIDAGADLVLGHHPHVLQEIEEYQDKYIVYSLGNFVFGGNRNPNDKDTMIFQQLFHYENGELTKTVINVVPCSLSGQKNVNDYRPIIVEGERADKIYNKVKYREKQ